MSTFSLEKQALGDDDPVDLDLHVAGGLQDVHQGEGVTGMDADLLSSNQASIAAKSNVRWPTMPSSSENRYHSTLSGAVRSSTRRRAPELLPVSWLSG